MPWPKFVIPWGKGPPPPAVPSALDVSPDDFNDYEQDLVANVRKHGWFETHVYADRDAPAFSYTTGFWVSLGQPELLVFGLPYDATHAVLWNLYRAGADGRSLPVGEPILDLVERFPLMLMPVAKRHYSRYLLSARWFYGNEDFPCLQVVWPDGDGLFPWEPAANPDFASSQPDLSDAGWRAIAGPGRAGPRRRWRPWGPWRRGTVRRRA